MQGDWLVKYAVPQAAVKHQLVIFLGVRKHAPSWHILPCAVMLPCSSARGLADQVCRAPGGSQRSICDSAWGMKTCSILAYLPLCSGAVLLIHHKCEFYKCAGRCTSRAVVEASGQSNRCLCTPLTTALQMGMPRVSYFSAFTHHTLSCGKCVRAHIGAPWCMACVRPRDPSCPDLFHLPKAALIQCSCGKL